MPLIRFFYFISMNQSVTNHTSVRLQKFKVHGVTLFYIFVYKWNTIILRVLSTTNIYPFVKPVLFTSVSYMLCGRCHIGTLCVYFSQKKE